MGFKDRRKHSNGRKGYPRRLQGRTAGLQGLYGAAETRRQVYSRHILPTVLKMPASVRWALLHDLHTKTFNLSCPQGRISRMIWLSIQIYPQTISMDSPEAIRIMQV